MSGQSPGDERPEGGDVPAPDGASAQVQVAEGGDRQVQQTAPMEGVDEVPEGGVDAPGGGETEGEQPQVIAGQSSGGPATGGERTTALEREVEFLRAELRRLQHAVANAAPQVPARAATSSPKWPAEEQPVEVEPGETRPTKVRGTTGAGSGVETGRSGTLPEGETGWRLVPRKSKGERASLRAHGRRGGVQPRPLGVVPATQAFDWSLDNRC